VDAQESREQALEIGQHHLHVFGIAFIHDSHSANAALARSGFMLQEVIFERFTADQFAGAAFLKSLCGCLASFELGHGFA
jgi:hypothetical protein